MYKNILAAVLLIYSAFGTGWLDFLDRPTPNPDPAPPPAKILDIETPNQNVKDRVAIFSELVNDTNDRAKLAIFNYEFAKRVLEYKATSQDVNDVYTIAGKAFFGTDLVDRYNGLAEEIIDLLSDCITDENHVITEEEKQKLNLYFMGVAWTLIQKGLAYVTTRN